MSHASISSNLAIFEDDIAAAAITGKDYVLGETNSVSGGGAATVSPLFGAALWTLDYSVLASTMGIKRTYFHHGTIGACYYCFWGRYDMGAPYYGAYVATAFMAGAASILELDDGSTNYAAYVVFDSLGLPLRALLVNSDYYSSGTRGEETFMLSGLGGTSLKAKRLTAQSADSRVDQGGNPTFGGQVFANETCVVGGVEVFESTVVSGGVGSFVVGESEALLVYLQ
jgi:hypothetical protein